MTKKKSTPKVSDEQVKKASDDLRAAEVKTEAPPPETESPAKEEKVKKTNPPKHNSAGKVDRGGKPLYLKKGVTEFMVGTEDYTAIVSDFNKLNGTAWNTHRVRPAVFYGIYQKMQEHYSEK